MPGHGGTIRGREVRRDGLLRQREHPLDGDRRCEKTAKTERIDEGPGILNELGIHQFEQIAAWSATDVDWVNERLKFKGRIEREEWIPQAKALLAAGDG